MIRPAETYDRDTIALSICGADHVLDEPQQIVNLALDVLTNEVEVLSRVAVNECDPVIQGALHGIAGRIEGLMRFVDGYLDVSFRGEVQS